MVPQAPRVPSETTASSSRSWEGLTPPLAEWMLEAMTSSYKRMTPVQASTIPLFNGNKDVVVEAVTGSGKTLAYVLPVVSKILRLEERTKKHHVASIIVSPTRELATQIHGVVQDLLAFHGPSSAATRQSEDIIEDAEGQQQLPAYPLSTPIVVPQLLIGGDISVAQDLSLFLQNSPNLLIATPGRLLELLNSPHVHCPQSSFEVLVLDEADRLLDLGFKDDLQKILTRLPKQRRTGLFSASVSEAVDSIVRVGLRNPVKIQVKVKGVDGKLDRRTPSSLQMSYLITPASHKLPAISQILSTLQPTPNKTIIYLSTCAAVDYFQHVLPSVLPSLNAQSFKLLSLHGKQPPKVRQKTFTAFTSAPVPSILLTTDIAARGLDIPMVDVVLQIDPPADPKVFLHRCGRTGRVGRKGLSIVLLQPGHEEDYIRFLEVRKTPVTPLKMPAVNVTDEDASCATQKIRRIVMGDRALHDKAQKAFVSSVKAYSKHQAASIFRISDIDWEDLGKGWGLLKLPKMPELKQWEGDKSLGFDMDWDTYTYKDKKREELRQRVLLDQQKSSDSHDLSTQPKAKRVKRAWSDKLDARNEREVRREKKHKMRDRDRWEQMTPLERERQLELARMIEKVKTQKNKDEKFDVFEGFDD